MSNAQVLYSKQLARLDIIQIEISRINKNKIPMITNHKDFRKTDN